MPHLFHELYSLMPKLDCGLCGNPSCQTMARKIAIGDIKPEGCLPLSIQPERKQNLHRIRRLLHEGIDIGAKGTIINEEMGLTYIHPCMTEAGKISAETKLAPSPEGATDLKYGFYDPIQLCTMLEASKFFQDVKCSPSLGIGRISVDDKTVLIHKDGRINVRKAKDKQDAIRTIRRVSRCLWGAIICSCGNAGVDCASGGCEQCQTQICPVASGGPPDPTDMHSSLTQQTKTSKVSERVKTLKTRRYFEKGMKGLDEAFNLFKQASLEILQACSVSNLTFRLMEERIVQANRLALQFIMETSNTYDAAIGLILSGVALDFSRIVAGLKDLTSSKSEFSSPTFFQLLSEATNIAMKAYISFRKTSFEGAMQVASQYEGFRKQWKKAFRELPQKDLLIAIGKIAANGFYMSRLLAKPVLT